ncbi:MAG: hypothetical protein JWP45_658 [Mucilaginibacter sp.]|nr:hypothetical protein [Mucilaginibacter sp.]
MTRSQKQYSDSYLYEAFMTRAYRASRDMKNGTDNGEFRLLEHIENGYYGKKTDYPKQVEKLKVYLLKAVQKVQKWKLDPAESEQVSYHATMVQQADDGDALATAMDGLLEATQRFKEY